MGSMGYSWPQFWKPCSFTVGSRQPEYSCQPGKLLLTILTYGQPWDESLVPCALHHRSLMGWTVSVVFLGLVPKLSQDPVSAGAVLFGVSCHFCMDGLNGMALAQFSLTVLYIPGLLHWPRNPTVCPLTHLASVILLLTKLASLWLSIGPTVFISWAFGLVSSGSSGLLCIWAWHLPIGHRVCVTSFLFPSYCGPWLQCPPT